MDDYKRPTLDYIEQTVDNPGIESELEKYHILKKQLKELESSKKQFREEIIVKLQKYSEATNHFGDIVTRLSSRKGSATVEWKDLLEEIIFTANDSQKQVIKALQDENKSTTKPYDKLDIGTVLDEAMDSTHVIRTLINDSEIESILDEEIEVIENLTDTLIDLGIDEGEFDESEFYNDAPISLAASEFYKEDTLKEDWVKKSPKPAKKTVQDTDPEIEKLVSELMDLDNQIDELKELIQDQKTVCTAKLAEYQGVVTQFGDYIAVYEDYPQGVTKTSHSNVVKTYLQQVTDSEKRVIESIKDKLTKTKAGGHTLAYNKYISESIDFIDNIVADEIQKEIEIVTDINNKMFDINNNIENNFDNIDYEMPLAASEFYDDSSESIDFEEEEDGKETLIEDESTKQKDYFIFSDDLYYNIEEANGLEVNLWSLIGKDGEKLLFENVDKPDVQFTADYDDIELYLE